MYLTKADIARAFLQIGFRTYKNVTSTYSVHRIREIYNKSQAYVEEHAGLLALNEDYFQVEQSEKTGISYFLGQALTALFAERFLDCAWVNHYKNFTGRLSETPARKTRPKIAVSNPPFSFREPDLLGYQAKGKIHLLEAKFYRSFRQSVFAKAVYQLSRVNTLDGYAPESRSVCYFQGSRKQIIGTIVDPEEEVDAFDYQFNSQAFFSSYYGPLFRFLADERNPAVDLSPLIQPGMFRRQSPNMREIMPGVYWGILPALSDAYLRFLAGQELQLQPAQFSNLQTSPSSWSFRDEFNSNISIGKDGIVFIDISNTGLPEKENYFGPYNPWDKTNAADLGAAMDYLARTQLKQFE